MPTKHFPPDFLARNKPANPRRKPAQSKDQKKILEIRLRLVSNFTEKKKIPKALKGRAVYWMMLLLLTGVLLMLERADLLGTLYHYWFLWP